MARNDKTNKTLELCLKVNEQNLSTCSEKDNISTLRLPTDPSWPKIPLRRLTNSANDINEPPCVITLTGIPTNNRNIVRAVTHQHSKSNKKYEIITKIPNRRLPACVDPRFRRQILQKPETLHEFDNMENNKQTTQLDNCILQKLETIEKNSERELMSTDNYMSSYHDINKLLESVTKSMKESSDSLIKKESTLDYCTMTSLCIANEQGDIKHRSVRAQIEDFKLTYQNDDVEDQEIMRNCSLSILTSKSSNSFKDEQYDMKNNNNTFERKSISCYNKCNSNWMHNKEKINFTVSLDTEKIIEKERDENNKIYQNFNVVCNIYDSKNDKNILNLNISEKLKTAVERNDIDLYIVTNNYITEKNVKRKRSLIMASLLYRYRNRWKQERNTKTKLIIDKILTNITRTRNNKLIQKYIQIAALNEIKLKKCNKSNNETKKNHKKSYIIIHNRKRALVNLSRKTKLFFRKKFHLANINSDYILMLHDPHRIKECQTLYKRYWKYYIESKRKIAMAKSRKKVEQKKVKLACKQFFGLKTIALLIIMTYIALIFLPMIHDQFFDEEYDDYENGNYIDLPVRCIASSFQQIFNTIINVLNIILLRIRFN